MVKRKSLIAGIDIGTTKICTTVAQMEENDIRILGTGWSVSRGLKKGIVANLSETIDSIKASLEKAEKQSQTVIESAYVSIGGAHLRGVNRSGNTEVRGKSGEITAEDIARALAEARSSQVPDDWEVIHELTQNFSIDGQDGIVNPLGMNGRRLSVNLHLVLNATAVVQNIVNAVNKAGVLVSGVVMQQLASAEAILSDDERELGTVVVDIGGGTSDVAIYSQGSIWHTEVLPMGGNLITKDIAIGLKAPLQEAEQLKKETAGVFPDSVPPEEVIEVSEVGTGRRRTVSRRLLCQIVQARCDELLQALARITARVGVQTDLVTGVVMTGGGALLDGLVERAEEVLQMAVRIGYPINVVTHEDRIFHPAYSTALGLLKYAKEIQGHAVAAAVKEEEETKRAKEQKATQRMKHWIFARIT